MVLWRNRLKKRSELSRAHFLVGTWEVLRTQLGLVKWSRNTVEMKGLSSESRDRVREKTQLDPMASHKLTGPVAAVPHLGKPLPCVPDAAHLWLTLFL